MDTDEKVVAGAPVSPAKEHKHVFISEIVNPGDPPARKYCACGYWEKLTPAEVAKREADAEAARVKDKQDLDAKARAEQKAAADQKAKTEVK